MGHECDAGKDTGQIEHHIATLMVKRNVKEEK